MPCPTVESTKGAQGTTKQVGKLGALQSTRHALSYKAYRGSLIVLLNICV